ncbi:MAG: hypothetical protein D6705_00795 [Deltaproteobacteria bacterium]|nr:MAG: hypothetical protein D6705_00795 [Deltaproteobacteria bacterium]
MSLVRDEEKTEPKIFLHRKMREWGRGTLLREADNKREILWEDDKVRNIHASHWDHLEEVALEDAEKERLDSELREKQAAQQAARGRAARKSKRASSGRKAPVSWPIQLRIFEQLYPGGFDDPALAGKERGLVAGKPPKKLAAAIAQAQDLLSEGRMKDLLDAGRSAELYRDLESLLKPIKSLLHFTEKAQITDMPEERRAAFVQAVFDAIHGDADPAEAFDRVVAAMPEEPRPSWTVASLFLALARPDDHVLVRPTFWLKQAAILDKQVPYDPRPTGAAYAAFLEVAAATRSRLEAAGYTVRDGIDVYLFTAKTLSPKAIKAFSGG